MSVPEYIKMYKANHHLMMTGYWVTIFPAGCKEDDRESSDYSYPVSYCLTYTYPLWQNPTLKSTYLTKI